MNICHKWCLFVLAKKVVRGRFVVASFPGFHAFVLRFAISIIHGIRGGMRLGLMCAACPLEFFPLQVLTEYRNLQSETVQSHSLDITEQGTSFANE